MIKTVILTGKEVKVQNLGGFNTVVHNLGVRAIYASKYPNIIAGADNVAEIPADGAKLISTTNGTVYLLGTGKAELTGQDHDGVNFKLPSSLGGDGTSGVTKAYVDEMLLEKFDAAKGYTDTELGSVRDDIADLQTVKADKSELPTALPANGGNADTVNGHTVNADVPANAKFTDTIIDVSGKMDTNNPTGTGAFSLNRAKNSTIGDHSFAEGYNTTASNACSHAEGNTTQANGLNAHSEGYHAKANGSESHAEGHTTQANGHNSHSEGYLTKTNAAHSHSEGYQSEINDIQAAGQHVEGGYTYATGAAAHAQGWATAAKHKYSSACGSLTLTGRSLDFVIGTLNDPKEDSLFTIGYGSARDGLNMNDKPDEETYNAYGRQGAALKNVFRVNTAGTTYGLKSYTTSGADYAEYIKPWFDDNPDNKDRRGYFVTVKNGKLCLAEPSDYIVGITSGNPSVIGNGDEDWLGRWKRDEFNELVYEDIEVDDYEDITDENGDIVSVKVGSHIEKRTIEVPEYDPAQEYIERKERPEWSCVGMIGVLPLRDDGTCVAGGFAKCGAGGIATAAAEWDCHKTFFVIERINDHIVSVEMR